MGLLCAEQGMREQKAAPLLSLPGHKGEMPPLRDGSRDNTVLQPRLPLQFVHNKMPKPQVYCCFEMELGVLRIKGWQWANPGQVLGAEWTGAHLGPMWQHWLGSTAVCVCTAGKVSLSERGDEKPWYPAAAGGLGT